MSSKFGTEHDRTQQTKRRGGEYGKLDEIINDGKELKNWLKIKKLRM